MPGVDPTARPRATLRGLARTHGWVVLACAAGLVVIGAIDFRPPERVRPQPEGTVAVVGDAPSQDFASDLGNPQAVQLRATLRRYHDPAAPVGRPDPELDARAQLLSQPIVTTLIGSRARIEQTLDLGEGRALLEVSIEATPRELIRKGATGHELATQLTVRVVGTSRPRWGTQRARIVVLDTRAELLGLDRTPGRLVFSHEGHLFSLDLELHWPSRR